MGLLIVLKDLNGKDKKKRIDSHDPEASKIFRIQLCARRCAQRQGYGASKTVKVLLFGEPSEPLGGTT